MDRRVNAGTHDREERHCLGGAVDRGAPVLAEEEKDRGNERAGMADADPEDEIGDVPGPADGDVVAPDANAFIEQPGDHQPEHAGQRGGAGDGDPPSQRGPGFGDAADPRGDRRRSVRAQHERFLLGRPRQVKGLFGGKDHGFPTLIGCFANRHPATEVAGDILSSLRDCDFPSYVTLDFYRPKLHQNVLYALPPDLDSGCLPWRGKRCGAAG